MTEHSLNLVSQHDTLIGTIACDSHNTADTLGNRTFFHNGEELGLSEIAEVRTTTELNRIVKPLGVLNVNAEARDYLRVSEDFFHGNADGNNADHIRIVLDSRSFISDTSPKTARSEQISLASLMGVTAV